MSKETTKKQIEVMQAYVNGMPIESKLATAGDACWKYSESPFWNWYGFDYRVIKTELNNLHLLNGKIVLGCVLVNDFSTIKSHDVASAEVVIQYNIGTKTFNIVKDKYHQIDSKCNFPGIFLGPILQTYVNRIDSTAWAQIIMTISNKWLKIITG